MKSKNSIGNLLTNISNYKGNDYNNVIEFTNESSNINYTKFMTDEFKKFFLFLESNIFVYFIYCMIYSYLKKDHTGIEFFYILLGIATIKLILILFLAFTRHYKYRIYTHTANLILILAFFQCFLIHHHIGVMPYLLLFYSTY